MHFKTSLGAIRTPDENSNFELSQNYKIYLFQTLPNELSSRKPASCPIDPTINDFASKMRQDSVLALIYTKIIEESLLYNSENASFYADKLLSLTGEHPIAVYLLGECYYLSEEYVKISYIFTRFDYQNLNENYAILAAKGLLKIKMFSQALKVLTTPLKNECRNRRFAGEIAFLTGKCQKFLENRQEAEASFTSALKFDSSNQTAFDGLCETRQIEDKNLHSTINSLEFSNDCLWLKKFYQVQVEYLFDEKEGDPTRSGIIGNIFGGSRAESPQSDSNKMQIETNNGNSPQINFSGKKVQFGNFMNNSNMLVGENKSIIESVPKLKKGGSFARQVSQDLKEEIPEYALARAVENIKVHPEEAVSPTKENRANDLLRKLKNSDNIHFLFLKLCYHFKNFQINNAYEICKRILEQNQFHFETILIYCEILVEKEEISELFSYSSKLAESFPEHYVTFHIIGMYYYYLKKYDAARRYFNRAIHINNYSLHTWLMLGHTYASQEESDPASNVYRSCLKLFPNSHLPHVYIGMEYLRINNLKTAAISFNHAKKIAGDNPMIYNEIGCIFLKQKKYEQAKKSFKKALKFCQANGINWLKHSILNNLANVHRKDKEYAASIQYYEQSLALCPNDPAVLFGLAFCYNLTGELSKAASLYHKVVSKKYDSHFVNHLLGKCMEDLAEKNFENMR